VLRWVPFSLSGIGRYLLRWVPVLDSVCFGLNLPWRLITAMVLPIALALGLVGVMKLCGHGVEHSVHLLLGWSFLVYPTVVSMGFDAIGECDCFENSDGTAPTCFLKADYNELCSRDAPLSGRPIIIALAVIAIVLFGFGVPLVHLALVLRDRHAIANDKPLVGLSAKISFLHADYSKHVYWWELIESMKKLVLTGFLALIVDPGTLIRLFVAIVIAFVMLMLQGIVSPMKSESDNVMSFLSAVMLLAVFIGTYACQAKPRAYESDDVDDTSWLVVLLLMVAIFVIFVATIVTFLLRLRELRARTAPSTLSLDTQLLPSQLFLPPL